MIPGEGAGALEGAPSLPHIYTDCKLLTKSPAVLAEEKNGRLSGAPVKRSS